MESANEKEFKEFGKRVKSFRKSKKITQQDLAYDCEVHKRTIQRIEKGDVNIGLETIFNIAKALEIKVGELFKEV
ncbi:MAG: helix-turn-helix domain-containing protein [Sphingobacteriales bacterium JAD_PAG50586_3]|nr:MAG: helix-turn-helix domain-containing protein [Sphingobacteriales bacterium JAD_PAG50586_3]